MTMRATDGEAVISARRAQGIDLWRDGACQAVVAAQDVARTGAALPDPDAASTAAWTRAVLAGKAPVPESIGVQFEAIRAAVQAGIGAAAQA
jgi:hypothetical protein